VEDLWRTILFMMKQMQEGKSTLTHESINIDPSLLHSRKAVRHHIPDAIATMTQARAPDLFPCNQKRRVPLQSYPRMDDNPLWSAFSLMASKRGGFVFRYVNGSGALYIDPRSRSLITRRCRVCVGS
jgi:hypothetical protein